MKKIVFDIETANEFSEIGSFDPTGLDISVVGVYDSDSDTYRAFLKEDFTEMWPIFEGSDMLIGYNSNHFDIPLLNKYYQGDLTRIKSLDLMKEIKDSLGKRLKLDSVAEATLGVNKSGSGLEALTWWRNGEVERVKQYCLDDVKITKELYDYAIKNGHLKYKDWNDIKEIPLDTARWEEAETASMTHSLPF